MANLEKKKLLDDPFGSVPKLFNQLGIFVLDDSISMYEDGYGGLKKQQILNHAVCEVLTSGTIISYDSGSVGRGQTAAAAKLSSYGVGLKISADRKIPAFHNGEKGFEFG